MGPASLPTLACQPMNRYLMLLLQPFRVKSRDGGFLSSWLYGYFFFFKKKALKNTTNTLGNTCQMQPCCVFILVIVRNTTGFGEMEGEGICA